MRLPFRALTRNWQLKLAALTLAVLLWVVVSAEQVTTQWIPVPVRVAAGDPGYVVTGGPFPAQVEVRFAGPGRELWELALERPMLVLPVDRVEADSQVFVLDPRMVRIPNGLSVSPLDVRPSSVRVLTQRVVTRDVPVRVRIARRSRDRYVVLDTPRVSPATVRVTGRADRVTSLEAVVTEPLEIGAADSVFRRGVPLDADSLGGVRASARSVEVSARVDRVVERIIPGVAVAAPAGTVAAPERVDVRVQGPSRQVRALDAAALAVTVLADSVPAAFPPGGLPATLRVGGVPDGLSARTVPASVLLSPAGGAPAAPPAPDSAAARPPEDGR
ncbi:MAG TPA: CdaR family protein [Longimicrobiaceae bacterium]|nr:CdaR family protein [Longimicrobiaceae bacterium]